MSKPRFLYHAHATGISGTITEPFHEILEVQAPASIPSAGGISKGAAADIRIRDLLHCSSVHTEVSGLLQESSQTHETRSSFRIGTVTIENRLKISAIEAFTHSSHHAEQDREPEFDLSLTIARVEVDGDAIELEPFYQEFAKLRTMSELREHYRRNERFRNWIEETAMIGARHLLGDQRLLHFFPWCHRQRNDQLPEHRSIATLPLFRVIKPKRDDIQVYGNVIHIANFGRVQFGELVTGPYARRITGVHVNLGSPSTGDATLGYAESNGTTSQPPPG